MAFRSRARHIVAGSVVAVLLFPLSACGGGDSPAQAKPPKEQRVLAAPKPFRSGTAAAKTALFAMRSVKGFRMRGYASLGRELVEVDLRFDGHGRCRGNVDWTDWHAILVVTDDVVYIQGDASYWQQGSGEDQLPAWFVRQAKDRWVHFPAYALPDMKNLCDLRRLLKTKPKTAFTEKLTGAYRTLYAGRPAIRLEYKDMSLTIEDKPTHRILGMSGGVIASDVRFSNYESGVTIDIPSGSLDVRNMTPY